MEYCVMISTTDCETFDYQYLEGTEDQVKAAALSRFSTDHPAKTVAVLGCLPMEDYMATQETAHQCRDTTGRDTCDHCGALITHTASWFRENGIAPGEQYDH